MPTLRPLFSRREDLTIEVRMRIASIALLFSVHGTISRLSDKYSISRQFIYDLRRDFKNYGESVFLSGIDRGDISEKMQSISWILSLRMEGKSSIEGISQILKRFNIRYNSVGFISQELQRIGAQLPNVLKTSETGFRVAICSDEIFSKGQAILITVDPLSLSILQIELSENRKGESWEKHWNRVLEAGYIPIQLCNDEGTGMASAKDNVLSEVERQSDTFHAVAHRLGLWVERLEKKAYGCIEDEYESYRLLGNAKTDEVFDKRYDNYVVSQKKTRVAIALFDNFVFLYHCLLSAFRIFDEKGDLKNSEIVLADFDTALDLLKSLGHQDINKEIKSIESCKKDLFNFMPVAKQIVDRLSTLIPVDTLKTLCLVWQTHKNMVKTKNTDRKNALKRKEKHLLQQLENEIQTHKLSDLAQWKNLVFNELNKIIQSSAAVECINSILRTYLNASKNQINQPFLNLFMAYHNHRRFKAGERKGNTPFEILSGQKQDFDWLEHVLPKAA
jgi:hypothetical protein